MASASFSLSEGMTVREEDLEDIKEVRLLVVELQPGALEVINEFVPNSESPIILDICLDFFSTKNPFLEVYSKSDLYTRLKDLYTFEILPSGLSEDSKIEKSLELSRARESLIKELQDVFEHLEQRQPLDFYDGVGKKHLEKVRAIKVSLMMRS